MKYQSYHRVIAGLALFGACSLSQAALIEADLNAVGDKLLTVDTSTGLEWLDVTATVGLNYFPAEATAYVTVQGFRHATQSEVSGLLAAFGINDIGSDTVANLNPVKLALTYLGNLGSGENHFLQGVYEFNGTNLAANLLQVNPFSTDTTGFGNLVQGSPVSKSHDYGGYTGIGHYLVRDVAPVPLPATLALFAMGLAGLGFFHNRKA